VCTRSSSPCHYSTPPLDYLPALEEQITSINGPSPQIFRHFFFSWKTWKKKWLSKKNKKKGKVLLAFRQGQQHSEKKNYIKMNVDE
jgi:hypothetical protein